MWLKIVILCLIVLMLASLSGALVTLFKDKGTSNRTVTLLGIRVSLAILILVAISYGLWSGTLVMSAPWHGQY